MQGADLLRRRQSQAGSALQPLPLLQLPPASLAVLAAGQPTLSSWTDPSAAADTPTLVLGSVQPVSRGSAGGGPAGRSVGQHGGSGSTGCSDASPPAAAKGSNHNSTGIEASTAAAAAQEAPHSSGRHRRGLSWGEKIGTWARSFGSPDHEPPGGDGVREAHAQVQVGAGMVANMQHAGVHRRSRSMSPQLFDSDGQH
jgi:hypothetical protein